MNERPFKNFTGSIDQLLNHCSKVNPDTISDDTLLNHEELVDTIVEDYHTTKEEAEFFAMQIKLEIVRETIQDLVAQGILEQKGYNEDGEPTYGLTEYGKQVYEKW
jgi:predicted transcriptional regulator